MRVLIQRVSSAAVAVDGDIVGAIDGGYLLLAGIARHDNEAAVEAMAAKIANLRLFEDDGGKINRSLLDRLATESSEAGVLVVSQFTLCASTKKGRRPSFTDAALPEIAEPLIAHFADQFRAFGVTVQTGRFGAHMKVALVNDGPVTIWLDSDAP